MAEGDRSAGSAGGGVMITSVAERVAAGTAWLDENAPDWAHQIDLRTFDITDDCYCVLGQVFGRYWGSPVVVKADEYDDFGDETRARALGFCAALNTSATEDFDELQVEWLRVIADRQAAGS